MDARFSSLLQQQQQRNSRRAAGGGGGGGGGASLRDFSPPPSSASRFHHHHHNPASLHHHRLHPSSSSLVDEPPRLFAPSGAPVPTDFCDISSILAYRQRVNGALPLHHSGIVSAPAPFARSQQTGVWDHSQRPQASLSSIHAAASLRPDVLDEAARFRLVAREFDRHNFGAEARDDVRRNEVTALSELFGSRRSAVVTAKFFPDEGRLGGAIVPRSGVYDEPPADLNSRRRTEREEAYHDARYFQTPQPLVERTSPGVGTRKRNREDLENGRERITRQRRVYDRGLAVLSTEGSSPLRLKRTPEIFGDPYLLRRVFSSGRNRDVEDRQEGQVTSSDRAFALQGTSSHRPFAPSLKHESHGHSFSPVTKSNQKPSLQHAGRGRALFPGRRSCSPRSESYASLPQRFDETGEKVIVTKAPGSPGTNLQIRESHFRELGARDKASMSGGHFVQLSSRKKEMGGGANQQLGRLDHSGPFSGQKRSKTGVVGTGGTPLKEQGNSFSRKHLTASGQKGHRPSRSSAKSSKMVEATLRKRLKSQVSRVIERSVVVSKGSPQSRQIKLEDGKRIIVEPHPAESIARACEEEENVHDVRQGEKIQRIDPVIQQNVGDEEHGHVDTGLNKHYQMVHTDSHGEHMLTNIDEILQSRSLKLSVASPLPCQNPLPFSEYRREALHEKSASPKNSQLLPHNRMSFNILETSFSPSKEHGIGSSLGTGWYSTLGSSLPSLTVCPQLQQSSSAAIQQLEGLSTKEGAVPSSLHERFLHPSGQIKADLLPLKTCVDVGAETSDRFMGKELRQMNECLPVIFDIQNFPQSSLARPSKAHTPMSAAEIQSYPYLDISTPYNVTGNIQTLSSPGFAQPFEQPTQTSIDGSKNIYHLAVAAPHDRKVDISMESSDKLAEADEILGNAAKETTTKTEDWLSGITLKTVSTKLIQQSEEAFPAPDELFQRKSKQGFSFTDLHLEQMGTSAVSPTVSPSMAASEVSLSAVDLSKEKTPISEAGRLGSGSKPDAPLSLVGHDRQGNYATLKQFSMVTPLPRGRMAPLPARAGARTWHRPADIDGLTVSHAMSKTVKISAIKPISQGSGKQKVSQLASYVRKGNSLVRAPTLHTPVVSSGLNTAPLHGAGKDTAGKVFPSFSRSQRTYPNVRTATKITRNSFRKDFPAREMPSNEPTDLPAEPHRLDNSTLQGGHGASVSHASAKAMSPGTPDSQPKALPLAKSVVDDESIQQSLQILRPNIVDSKLDDIKPASLEVTSSMLNKSKLVYPGIQPSNAALKNSETSSMYYVKSKANQLIASLPLPSLVLTKAEGQSGLPHSGASAQDLYYKRKNNQLVRNGTEIKDASSRLLKSPLTLEVTKGRTNAIRQTTLGKALRQKRANLPSSRVWTLNGEVASQVKGAIPLLFPWKRPGLGVAVRAGRFKALPKAKKGSLLFLISKKLQRLRKLQPVYTRSACGFSLHRSGVLSLSGANLKWTKSIEKRSKQASEEATKAVAAVEKKRREEKEAVAEAANAVAKAKADRRAGRSSKLHPRERIVMIGLVHYKMDALQQTLQRMPDEWCGSDKTSTSRQGINSAILSTPRRLCIGGMEYVRVGNGHQLIRDPKAASRALASEKVRWSLHTARFRHAKKKQYCLFFTRFGKCNKGEGTCPYIHDSEKVAVCTKFLMGTCSGTDCLLTHRIIPERMPDCSFFLEGLCTNENCPYRHVSVNPKAPICEGFLKGYCADGDECNKKHTSVCPTFAETGECSDRSTCKFHHPKKKGKRVIYVNPGRVGLKRKRRYFVTGNLGMSEQGSLPSVEENQEFDSTPLDMGNTDFIGLPNIEIDLSDTADDFKRKLAFIKQQLPLLQKDFHRGEEDICIKPILLLQRHADSVRA